MAGRLLGAISRLLEEASRLLDSCAQLIHTSPGLCIANNQLKVLGNGLELWQLMSIHVLLLLSAELLEIVAEEDSMHLQSLCQTSQPQSVLHTIVVHDHDDMQLLRHQQCLCIVVALEVVVAEHIEHLNAFIFIAIHAAHTLCASNWRRSARRAEESIDHGALSSTRAAHESHRPQFCLRRIRHLLDQLEMCIIHLLLPRGEVVHGVLCISFCFRRHVLPLLHEFFTLLLQFSHLFSTLFLPLLLCSTHGAHHGTRRLRR